MDILPLHFRVLNCGGLWWETDEQHWFVRYIWKPLIVIVILVLALTTMSGLAVPNIDVNDIANCLFVTLNVFALFFKVINFLCKRQCIIELLSEFREPICLPRTTKESEILAKNVQFVLLVFKCHLCMAYSSGTLFLLLPLLRLSEGTSQMKFPYATYEIFNKDNVFYYTVTYTFQTFVSIIAIAINASLDTILAGFIRLTCSQIDLCCHRFTYEKQINVLGKIKRCALHHCIIQKIVRHLESIFICVVVPFLFLSLVTICTSVYNLSQRGVVKFDSIPFLTYTGVMLAQIFFYCWFGNELVSKGIQISETLYNYDWEAMEIAERKNLLYLMIVCQKPLSLSFRDYCVISMDSYVWIVVQLTDCLLPI